MQTVKYINPNGQEVTFDLTPPFLFEKITGTGALDAQAVTSEAVGQDGKTFHGSYVDDREVTVHVHIKGKDRRDMYEQRRRLTALLSTGLNAGGKLGRLEYQNDLGHWWIPAYVRKGPATFDRVANYQKSVPITFNCPDPYWRALQPVGDIMAYLDGGLEFPLEIDSELRVQFGSQGYQAVIRNEGDSAASLVITIYGPAAQPAVSKTATGETLRVNRELATGDRLTINTAHGNDRQVMITRTNGTMESAFGYIDLESVFFQLDPGENALEYRSGDDGRTARVEVLSYPRFGGV